MSAAEKNCLLPKIQGIAVSFETMVLAGTAMTLVIFCSQKKNAAEYSSTALFVLNRALFVFAFDYLSVLLLLAFASFAPTKLFKRSLGFMPRLWPRASEIWVTFFMMSP